MPLSQQEREDIWYKIEDDRKKVLPASIRVMSNALTRAIQPVIDSIENFSDTGSLIERAPSNVRREELRKGYQDLYQGVMPKFAQQKFEELMKSAPEDYTIKQDGEELEDMWIQDAKRYVENQLPYRITGVTKTTEDKVRSIISKAVEDGKSIPDIAREIDKLGLDDVIRNRSTVVARTEIVNASNKGSIMGARSTRLDLQKEWISTLDNRTRVDHADANGQVVEIDSDFLIGGYEADYPGDPSLPASQSIQCRCTQVFKTR